jgi:hypothetical protein
VDECVVLVLVALDVIGEKKERKRKKKKKKKRTGAPESAPEGCAPEDWEKNQGKKNNKKILKK